MVREGKVSNRARLLRYLIVSNDGLARGLMSHAYFKKRLRDARLSKKVGIVLSGLMVSRGTRPDEIAKKILKEKGVPLNGFIVEPVTAGLLAKADVVLTLSKEDSNYVRNTYGNVPARFRTLDVPVILGASAENYERAWAKIHAGIDEEIRRLASKS